MSRGITHVKTQGPCALYTTPTGVPFFTPRGWARATGVTLTSHPGVSRDSGITLTSHPGAGRVTPALH
eukprot:1160419-Prorocentrum_minimum.AAC.1